MHSEANVRRKHSRLGKRDSAPQKAIDLEIVARELWRERLRLAKFASLGLILGLAAAFLTPVSYTAIASFVPPSSSGASSALASSLSSLSLLGPVKSSSDLYLGVLKSRSLADAMIERFQLMNSYGVSTRSKAEKVLSRKSSFEVDPKSTIVTVKATDHDAVRARDMANAYLEEVRSISNRLALTESSQRRLFYEERLSQAKNDLANAEVALKQTEERTGFIAPAGQTASELQSNARLRAEITSRQVQIAGLRRFQTDESPEILRLESEIGNLQTRLAEMKTGKGSESGVVSTSKVPSLALDYIRKERDVKYYEALFEIIAKQYENARLDEAHALPLQVLDYAIVPDTKSWPPRILFVLGGTICLFAVGVAWVLYDASRGGGNLITERAYSGASHPEKAPEDSPV